MDVKLNYLLLSLASDDILTLDIITSHIRVKISLEPKNTGIQYLCLTFFIPLYIPPIMIYYMVEFFSILNISGL